MFGRQTLSSAQATVNDFLLTKAAPSSTLCNVLWFVGFFSFQPMGTGSICGPLWALSSALPSPFGGAYPHPWVICMQCVSHMCSLVSHLLNTRWGDPAILWGSLCSSRFSCKLYLGNSHCLVLSKLSGPSPQITASAGFCLDLLLAPWPRVPLSAAASPSERSSHLFPIFLESLVPIRWYPVSWKPLLYFLFLLGK